MRLPPKPKRLFAPVDATETRRQGQGIGDLEAMRQMATTAIPEVLRNLPATSTPMSVFDMAKAVADRDAAGAGMAALGMIPFAGAMRYADDAVRVAKSLPMDEASRMARAAEQGFTRDVYHGTGVPDITEMRPSRIGEFGPGVYTTTHPAEASSYAISRQLVGQPNVLPLKVRLKNPVETSGANDFWDRYGHLGKTDDEVIDALQRQGHDGLIIRRALEKWDDKASRVVDTGEMQEHVVVWNPKNIRSRFAAFDPANIGKAGLMGALAATLGGAAARQSSEAKAP